MWAREQGVGKSRIPRGYLSLTLSISEIQQIRTSRAAKLYSLYPVKKTPTNQTKQKLLLKPVNIFVTKGKSAQSALYFLNSQKNDAYQQNLLSKTTYTNWKTNLR